MDRVRKAMMIYAERLTELTEQLASGKITVADYEDRKIFADYGYQQRLIEIQESSK